MILQFLSAILVLSIIFKLVPYRRRNFWNWLLLLSVFALIVYVFPDISVLKNQVSGFKWMAYPSLYTDFILGGSEHIISAIICLLPILLVILYLNAMPIYSDEHPLSAGCIVLYQFCALVILISAQNFIQLMVGAGCISILGFYLISDSDVKKHYIFYSYIAEMSIFTALAIVYSQFAKINIVNLSEYGKTLKHQDLVLLLILCGVFIKCGMFLFQNYILELQNISFNRILSLSLLSSPLSGLIIFSKLSPLIFQSNFAKVLILTFVILSVLWSLIGICWRDSLSAKILYMNMLFFSMAIYLLCNSADNIYLVIRLLPLLMVLDICLYPADTNRKNIMLSSSRLYWKNHKTEIFMSLVIVSLSVTIILSVLVYPLNYICASLLGIAFIIILRGLYNNTPSDNIVFSHKISSCVFPVVATIIMGYFLYAKPILKLEYCYVYGGLIILLIVVPNRFIDLFAHNTAIQSSDLLKDFYNTFIVAPLRLLGRILWLLVDFVVIERSLIGNLSQFTSKGVSFLRAKQNDGLKSWIVFLFLGLLLIIINIGSFLYE